MNFHKEPATYVGHVHLLVSDLERSQQFYEKKLGLQVLNKKENVVAFTADGNTPLVIIEHEENAQPKRPRTTGLYHFALLLPNRRELAKVLIHLVQSGYPLQGASDHQFSEAVYLADPEGNGIELYADRSPEIWAWQNGELPFVSDPLDTDSLLKESENEPWTGFPSDTVMGHIHLHVSNLQKAKEFYCDGLGFEVTVPFRHQALFVASNKYHHHIGLNTWQGEGAPAPAANSLGMKEYSIIYPTEAERTRVLEQLKKINAPVSEEEGDVRTTDPAGNRILLLV
ncbi:VOC family protein [Halalkalibacterium ligniniphilum]|uniref:VOC family protein n=1 Tax=Halalkalibacterium ligniniphilum TaxID=1134413 RepID=UPI000349404C|nr:VOC family protein [Halalkalibacterium ligniniphilum]